MSNKGKLSKDFDSNFPHYIPLSSKENKYLEMGNLFQTLLSNWLHFNFKTKIMNPSNQRCLWTKNWASDIASSKKREQDKARIWTWPTALFSYCYICFYFLFFSTFIYCFLFYLLFQSSVYFIGKNVNVMCFYLLFSTLTYPFVYIHVFSCFFSISFLFVGKGENSTCSTFIANSIGKSVNMTCSKGHDRTGHPYECPHQLHFKGWNYRCIFPYL